MSNNKTVELLSEDSVRCLLFPMSSVSYNLEELCVSVNKIIKTLSAEYIWHRDEFKFCVPINDKNELPDHLISVTCFGDNIEDEWFIVYLMLEITKQHELIGQVYDNDGEFLLIEAADLLPSWANPDSTENRVFIYQSHIHLIPPTLADSNKELRVNDAIKFISDMPAQTISSEIQHAIMKRLAGYPEKINENMHRAKVDLPDAIATLLTIKPSLISPIVNAYCNHDIIEAKTLKNVSFKNCLTTKVKFTKCLYAMLMHSRLPKNLKHIKVNENEKKSTLGLKITCGYEIIMNKLSQDIFTSKEFNKFMKSLKDNGYFKRNIEGSKDYKLLLEQAKEFFLSMECPINLQICNTITQLMQTKEFTEVKNSMKQSDEDIEEDTDEWLNVDPEQLNDLLNSRYGKPSKLKTGDILNSDTITTELSKFLKQSSDFEGIETSTADDSEDNNIEFDSEQFMNTLNNMMKYFTTGNEAALNGTLNEDDMEDDFSEEETDMDAELKESLCDDQQPECKSSKSVLVNMRQSVKEEQGSSGPTSNILRTIGIKKNDLLDSDDDE